MPTSIDFFTTDVPAHISALNPKTALDIGAGAGKYGDMLKRAGIIADAVEPVRKYIDDYSLRTKYRDVYHMTAAEFFKNNRDRKYDLIIAGDVMEHMYLNDAIGVIDAMLYKAKHVMLIWPTNLPQDSESEEHYEMHLSNIKLSDLTRFNVEVYKRTYAKCWNDVPIYAHYALLAGHTTKYNEGLRRMNIAGDVAYNIINDV